eukprot:XP_011663748.1 PREDICTED: SCO-spondin-like [Strongylocentrotus purpuratus]
MIESFGNRRQRALYGGVRAHTKKMVTQAENCKQDETYSVFRHPCDYEESQCPGYPKPPYRPGGPPIAGCFCNEGLLRHNESCEDEGEFFNDCGSPCGEPSCDERDRGKGECIESCQPGCFCDSANGFIRDQSNRCIQEEQCTLPGQCINEGEVYRVCSSHCGEATCAGVPQVRCANLCLSLCLCDNDNGYVRGPNGDCILLSNCQQAENCKQDETYSVFRHPCDYEESQCPGYPEPPYRPGGPPIAGCFCSEGLLRHNGQCISPGDCPSCDVVNCFVDPCLLATCGASPNARCMSNYCGGCNFIFYDSQCHEVQCDGKPTY